MNRGREFKVPVCLMCGDHLVQDIPHYFVRSFYKFVSLRIVWGGIWCLIKYRVVISEITLFKKCFPRSLTNSNG